MLCGLPTVTQAAIGDCLSFDPFSLSPERSVPGPLPSASMGWCTPWASANHPSYESWT